jgi:hypothetical protein
MPPHNQVLLRRCRVLKSPFAEIHDGNQRKKTHVENIVERSLFPYPTRAALFLFW